MLVQKQTGSICYQLIIVAPHNHQMPGIIRIRHRCPPQAVLQVRLGRQFAVKPSAGFVDSIVNEQHLDTVVVNKAASGHFNPAACRFIRMYARLNRRANYYEGRLTP
jgi:hypothetical protein